MAKWVFITGGLLICVHGSVFCVWLCSLLCYVSTTVWGHPARMHQNVGPGNEAGIPPESAGEPGKLFDSSFIEIQFKYHTIHQFKVCSSMTFLSSQSCASITTINSRTFPSHPKVTPDSPSPTRNPRQPQSTFWLCGFACSGRFLYTELYNTRSFVSAFLHSA